ncbi:MAG: ATP-binding protein [Thermoproteus sp.]
MRRIRLDLARDLVVEFADREAAFKRVEEWAERGTRLVKLVFGPEGCGKSAWLRQSAELLRELGFDVLYVNPLQREFLAYIDLKEVVKRFAEAAAARTGIAEIKLADLAVQMAIYAIKKRRRKIAVLADDVFQAIGLDKAASYVKWMLGVIEYPPGEYERIVAVAATSEGLTRREIGRHMWADHYPMWNMSREGFRQLYDQIPGHKPPFEEVWRLTGGNPRLLGQLYEAGWDVDRVVEMFMRGKELNSPDLFKWRGWLEKALEDPDVLWTVEAPEGLLDRLVERNLVVHNLHDRDPSFWVDAPPPERDPELGVGKYVAWQTPLHREAVRRALGAG